MSTGHEDGHDDKARSDVPLRCPSCGSVLGVRLLELPDEDEPETLLFDCPRGDFHATLTRQDIIAALTAAVREQLGYGRLVNPAA